MTNSVLPRPDVAPARPWSFPQGRRFGLPNGLTVLVYDLPGKQVVATRLLLDLPLAAEPVGLEGVATLAMSALDEGAAGYDAHGFSVARNKLGATYAASCDANGGTVSLDVPASRLPSALDLLAEAALRPTFPATEVDRLVKQRLDAITAELASPDARGGIELAKAYYVTGSRRAVAPGGSAQSVARLDRDVVETFYRSQVDPATTTLVVAGDLTGIDLEGLVQASFGGWESRGRVRASLTEDDLVAGPQVVVVDRPGSVQTMLALAVPGVSKSHADLPGLMVAAYALGGGLESRLMTVLREEKGYTYGIRAMLMSERYDGRLIVMGSVQTEVTGPAVDDLLAILRGFAADGIREEERAPAVEQLAGRAPLSYETASAVATGAATLVAHGLPDDYLDTSRAALRETTVASVNEAFARSAPLDQAVLIAVGDGSVITEPLRSAGLGEVTVVKA